MFYVGHVFIKTLSGLTVPLEVSTCGSVYAVKMKIQKIMGVAVAQQRLVHSGRTLSDDKTLEMYNIHREDTIYLVLKSGGKELIG